MTEQKKSRFGSLYLLGLVLFFFGGDFDIMVYLGMFTIIFTSLAHLIFKIVTLQEGFNAGTQGHPQTRRPMFSSQRQRGNPSYDQLIRKMQVSDLSGMSVRTSSFHLCIVLQISSRISRTVLLESLRERSPQHWYCSSECSDHSWVTFFHLSRKTSLRC